MVLPWMRFESTTSEETRTEKTTTWTWIEKQQYIGKLSQPIASIDERATNKHFTADTTSAVNASNTVHAGANDDNAIDCDINANAAR